MNPAIVVARVRTRINRLFRRDTSDAVDAIWASIEPALNLSRGGGTRKRRFRIAHHVLAASLPRPARYLEVGAFEGGSLAFVHALLKGQMQATAIDPFVDYDDYPNTNMSAVEVRFRANVQAIGADVRILRGPSFVHLPSLIAGNECFDLIYVDGSHAALDVVVDAVLCWRLLAQNGLMIFDDYRKPGCGSAIDAFLALVGQDAVILEMYEQVFLRRTVR